MSTQYTTPTVRTTLLAADLVAFGTQCRSTDSQRRARKGMYDQLTEAFAMTGLSWAECHHEDRGDGALIVAPPDADSDAFLDPLLHHLAALQRRYNRDARESERLRLRLALHHGQVHYDDYGVISPATVRLFRMLEAPFFKKTIRNSDTDLGAIVSHALYTEATGCGGLTDPAAYQEVRVTHKEARRIRAWIWLSRS